MKLYLATDDGLIIGDLLEGEADHFERVLGGFKVTSVIAREGVILAGTTEGIQRSGDGGRSWEAVNAGLTIKHIRWLAYHPEISDLEFAGTEPAGLFVSSDGAESWQGREEVGRLRDQFNWFLPYSPEAGCVRGFAFQGDRLYAAVEVGGLLVSDNRGQDWDLVSGSDGVPKFGRPTADYIHPDVHSVAIHPVAKEMVYAPTGGGFYISENSGDTWTIRYDDCYCRAVWVDPADPDHLILGPASNVDRGGRIEETFDGGRSWKAVQEGSQAPWPNHMVERFHQVGDDLFGVLSNGDLITAEIGKWQWRRVFSAVSDINDISHMA